MGLKEMIEAQRAKAAAEKAAQAEKLKPPTPTPQVAPPQTASQTVQITKPKLVLGKPAINQAKPNRVPEASGKPASLADGNGAKANEKVTAEAQVAPQIEQRPQVAENSSVVVNGAANSHAGNQGSAANPSITDDPGPIPEAVIELKKNIAFLSANIEQKELVGQVVRRVLMDLKKNPQFSTHMVDTDFNTITRACRRASLIAARQKSEARETRKAKRKDDDDFASQMKGMDFDLGAGKGGGGWS